MRAAREPPRPCTRIMTHLDRMNSFLLAAIAIGAKAAAPAPCPDHLFTIERSKNANLVVYDARRTESGELDPKQPVVVYWILNAKNGEREELNRVESQRAYGFDIAPGKESGTYALTLKGGKKRPFLVAMREGCPVVLDTIDGREAILDRIYVKAKDDGLSPKVEFVEIFGRDAADGHPRTEKIFPKP
jgi:Domain of unknown function (DUF4833)